MEMLQHQRLVVILSAHRLGFQASRVVEPTELILRRWLDLADDRPLDPFPDPLQKLRIRAGTSSRAAAAGDNLFAVDLDLILARPVTGDGRY